jgi:hypothetical protein
MQIASLVSDAAVFKAELGEGNYRFCGFLDAGTERNEPGDN